MMKKLDIDLLQLLKCKSDNRGTENGAIHLANMHGIPNDKRQNANYKIINTKGELEVACK